MIFRWKYIILILMGTFLRMSPLLPQLIITEICAAPGTSFRDTIYNQYPDWFEIENKTDKTIDLKGFYFSDDPEAPYKYKISETILIKPEEPFMMIADGKGYSNRTNFRLSRKGEMVSISNPDGTLIDSVRYGYLESGISMGRGKCMNEWFYFENPSPGSQNPEPLKPKTARLKFEHDLPVILITADSSGLWGDSTGIYVVGKNGITGYCNNLRRRNYCRDWERSAHIEYYDESGIRRYAGNAGIKIHGNCSRNFPQRSLALFARSKYGNGKFNYPFFGEKNIGEFEALVLRNSGNDNRKSMMRDAIMSRLAASIGNIDYQAYTPVVVYLKGNYWGIYNLREKLNEHYLFDNHAADPEKVIMMEDSDKLQYGDRSLHTGVFQIMQKEKHAEIRMDLLSDIIDIEEFMNYMIAQIYCANTDWPGKNVRYWRTPERKWRWILYDTDLGFGLKGNDYNTNIFYFLQQLDADPDYNKLFTVSLFMELMHNEKLRTDFSRLLYRQMDTHYSPESVIAIIEEIRMQIESEMPNHLERWNLDIESWHAEVEKIKKFALLRPAILKKQFENFLSHYQ